MILADSPRFSFRLTAPLTAFAIDIIQYNNAAVDYLNSLGIAVEDLSEYSHKEIKEAVKTIDAGESSPLTEEILSLIPENMYLNYTEQCDILKLPNGSQN